MKPGSTAVTEEASAAFENEPTSNFLPTDKTYRLTGEMPAERDEEETPAAGSDEGTPGDETGGVKDESHTSKSDTSAASEAAPSQKTGPAQGKTAPATENRFQKLSRENKELREQLARETATKQRDASQGSQPAAVKTEAPVAKPAPGQGRGEPKIDDVDATGKPKYATYGDYLKDIRSWDREEALRQFNEQQAKATKDSQLQDAEKTIERVVTERAQEARKAYSDYDTVVPALVALKDEHGQDAYFYTKGSHIDGFFLDSDRGHDVIYAIAKNFDQHKHIFARNAQGQYVENPVRQLRELAKIENSLPAKGQASAAASSAKPVTNAPRPPHQVSGQGTVVKDAVEEAVEEGDSEAYIRAANAKDPRLKALRAKKG